MPKMWKLVLYVEAGLNSYVEEMASLRESDGYITHYDSIPSIWYLGRMTVALSQVVDNRVNPGDLGEYESIVTDSSQLMRDIDFGARKRICEFLERILDPASEAWWCAGLARLIDPDLSPNLHEKELEKEKRFRAPYMKGLSNLHPGVSFE